MSDAYLAPYLSFDGNCKEAMEFYHGVMGGELESHTFAEFDMPGTPEHYKTKIMHSMITNDSLIFMASDSPPGMFTDKFGTSWMVNITSEQG